MALSSLSDTALFSGQPERNAPPLNRGTLGGLPWFLRFILGRILGGF